jgi:glutamine synthetase type III
MKKQIAGLETRILQKPVHAPEPNILNPCPLCGGEVKLQEITAGHSYNDGKNVDHYARIECICGLSLEREWTTIRCKDGIVFRDEDIFTFWIKKTIKKHSRIIFNGNNYAEEWHKEAKKRGLVALNSTSEALPYITDKKSIELFTTHKVFTESELVSRRDVKLNTYSKTLKIEALTMLEMVKRDILPAVINFKGKVSSEILALSAIGPEMDCSVEKSLLAKVSKLSMKLGRALKTLEQLTEKSDDFATNQAEADYYNDKMLPAMNTLREIVDELETMVAREDWPYPSYTEMLYSVR